MVKLSGIIIAKNEEEMIADCLESLKFCDEIIVVDNNSADRTSELSRMLGAKVFKVESEDFSALRNYGLKKANYPFVLYVDADERVSPQLSSQIKAVLLKETPLSSFEILRKNFYFSKEWPYVEKMQRLFNKKMLRGWKGKLHESPVVQGKTGILKEGFLLHYTHRDLASMLDKTIEWSKTEAKLRFDNNHPSMSLWRFFRVMATGFLNSFVKQKGYEAGTMGLVESIYQAFSMFITYARLWEMQNRL